MTFVPSARSSGAGFSIRWSWITVRTVVMVTTPGLRAAVVLEKFLSLCPIEDRRQLDSTRDGMLEGFSLGSYLVLVDRAPFIACSDRLVYNGGIHDVRSFSGAS
jgi:hypothetical protein